MKRRLPTVTSQAPGLLGMPGPTTVQRPPPGRRGRILASPTSPVSRARVAFTLADSIFHIASIDRVTSAGGCGLTSPSSQSDRTASIGPRRVIPAPYLQLTLDQRQLGPLVGNQTSRRPDGPR